MNIGTSISCSEDGEEQEIEGRRTRRAAGFEQQHKYQMPRTDFSTRQLATMARKVTSAVRTAIEQTDAIDTEGVLGVEEFDPRPPRHPVVGEEHAGMGRAASLAAWSACIEPRLRTVARRVAKPVGVRVAVEEFVIPNDDTEARRERRGRAEKRDQRHRLADRAGKNSKPRANRAGRNTSTDSQMNVDSGIPWPLE